jgi:hypothetical protein
VESLLRRWLITLLNEVLRFKHSRKYATSVPTAHLSLILHWTNGWFCVRCSRVKLKFRQKIRLVSAPLILDVFRATGRGVAVLPPFSTSVLNPPTNTNTHTHTPHIHTHTHTPHTYIHTYTHTHTLPAVYLFFDEGRECGELFLRLLIYFWTWTQLGCSEGKVSGTGGFRAEFSISFGLLPCVYS